MKRSLKFRPGSKMFSRFGLTIFAVVFAALGTTLLLVTRAAPGVCSTTNVVGTSTIQNISVPETGQYRLWVRMQVPDTSNTNNLNGVRVELAGSSNQCFTVTANSGAANAWRWINSDASASGTPAHITSAMVAGTYTAKIMGLKAGVKVDSVLLLRSDNTCTPSNDFSSGSPGDNCIAQPTDVDRPVIQMQIDGKTLTQNQTTITINDQKSVTWRPTATDSGSGLRSVTATINGQATGAAPYVFGGQPQGNGDYALRVVAVDNANNTATADLQVRLRHPDMDRSGTVNITDLSMVLGGWLATNRPGVDLNTNGVVDIFDLSVILGRWGSTQ